MEIVFFDSELKVMEVLWEHGSLSAGEIAKILKDEIKWNRNTTYTVIKKCITKGAIARIEPGFICSATITKVQAQQMGTAQLIQKYYQGNVDAFFSAFIPNGTIAEEEIEQLREIINASLHL